MFPRLLSQADNGDVAAGSAVSQGRVAELLVMAGIGGAALKTIRTFCVK